MNIARHASALTATLPPWHVTGRLEAYEGDTQVLVREWNKKIPRLLL